MTENATSHAPPNSSTTATTTQADVPGLPFYEKSRVHLRDLLRKQQTLQRNLANLEETIYRKETEYLEDTPGGNIILGFDGFVKGTSVLGTGGGGGGRRGGVEGDRARGADGRGRNGVDGVRLFSRSSVSYRPGTETVDSPSNTGASTPGNSAPTPVSTSFAKNAGAEAGSGNATPTSSKAGGNKAGAAAADTGTGAGNKKKKVAAGSGAGGEDSETDGRESKKARTAFGSSVRK